MDRRSFLLAASAAVATASLTRASAKTPQAFGAVPDGRTDSSRQLQAMLDAGGDIRWTAGAYLAGGLVLRSNTHIAFDPGVVINGVDGQKGVLRAGDVENLTLQGQAEIFGPPGMQSHTVNLSGVKRATLQGLKIGGGSAGGGGKDALYIGPGTKGPCEDIHIDGCALHDALRNGLSITACRAFVVENCDVSGAHGAPGSGIDVEANQHGMIGGGVIRNNRVHDNQRYGILVAFGDGVQIYGNEVFGNGLTAVAVAAGSSQWNEQVFRPGVDVVAVAGLDPSTGRLMLGDAQGIEIGSVISFQTRKGVTQPGEFAQSRFMVIDKDPAGRWIALSPDAYTTIGRLTQGPSLRLSADPAQTDVRLRVYAPGQASNVEIYGNRIHGNQGARGLDLSTSIGVRVHDNDIEVGPDQTGVFAAYARGLSVYGNRLHGDLASTKTTSRGLHFGMCSQLEHRANQIDGFGYAGVLADGVLGYDGQGDTITNCGWLPEGAAVRIGRIRGGKLSGEIVRNDPDRPATYGIYGPEALADTAIEGNDLTGSGAPANKRLAIADRAARVGANAL